MATPMRVTGAWVQQLTDWLDLHQLAAPALRLLLDSRRQDEAVPLAFWQSLLAQAVELPTGEPVPALEIGAQVRPRMAVFSRRWARSDDRTTALNKRRPVRVLRMSRCWSRSRVRRVCRVWS